MKRFVFSVGAIAAFMTASGVYGQTPERADAQDAETKDEMPGSWGNIPLSDEPSPETSQEIGDKTQWDDIALSVSDEEKANRDEDRAHRKPKKHGPKPGSKRIDNAEWTDIPESVPRAAALAPAPSQSLDFSATGQMQTDEAYNAKGDPHKNSRTWLTRPPAYQISHEAQLRPLSGGGIFVPAMTGGTSEIGRAHV